MRARQATAHVQLRVLAALLEDRAN
eukprot:COSAG06_NODE_68142_length_238_cov_12.661871_1_plen_24_part_01